MEILYNGDLRTFQSTSQMSNDNKSYTYTSFTPAHMRFTQACISFALLYDNKEKIASEMPVPHSLGKYF